MRENWTLDESAVIESNQEYFAAEGLFPFTTAFSWVDNIMQLLLYYSQFGYLISEHKCHVCVHVHILLVLLHVHDHYIVYLFFRTLNGFRVITCQQVLFLHMLIVFVLIFLSDGKGLSCHSCQYLC